MTTLPSGTVTFLFTDIQDSTRLWEKHPSAMRQVLSRHDEIIETLAKQYDGFVVRPRGEGDSRFVVFARAYDGVSATAAIQQALYAEEWPERISLRVRMALHTGEGEYREGDYYGSAVNRCARLRGLAHGGQTLFSQSTYELVQDNLPEGLTVVDLGKRLLKGLERPEHIFQLVAPGLPTEFPPLAGAGGWGEAVAQPPAFLEAIEEHFKRPVFVGRERELAWLDGFLEQALSGQGTVVFVTGGPGRGKTALLDEFTRRAMEANPELLAASGSCNAFSGVGDPYLPFREVMDLLSGDVEAHWEAGAISTEHARRLWEALPLAVQALLDHGPHVTGTLVRGKALLSRARAAAPDGALWLERLRERVARQTGAPEGLEQSHLFQQVTHVLRALAEHHPLLLVLDDLQWTDTASASLLFHLGRRLTSSRILIVGTYRPEEVALGRQGEPHPLAQVLAELKRALGDIWLDLAEVQEPEGRHFVDALLATEPNRLGEGFRRSLFEHTGGHPLFTVELLRAMQERGDLVQDEAGRWVEGASLDWGALPARVEGVIEARIGRLEEKLRDALAVASVEGEDFTAQVVARVQEVSDRKLLRTLSRELERRHRLVRGRGEEQVGRRRLSRYRFAHALFQKYLYNELSPGECRLLHAEVAGVLEELHEGNLEEVAAPLAHHFSAAGDEDRTLKYLILAGDRALGAYAHAEAEGYYRRALELGPGDSERAHLLSGLGEALSGQGRYTEAIQTWRQGIELYKALEDSDGLARLYARLVRAAREANEPGEDLRLGLEGLATLEGVSESHGLALLLHEVALAYCYVPSQEDARPFAQQAMAMAERLGDVEVLAHGLATLGGWELVPEDEALAALARAVELAETHRLLKAGMRAHNNLGVASASHLSDLAAAVQHYRRAAELAHQAGDIVWQVSMLSHLSDALTACGFFAEAETILSRVRSLRDDLPEPGLAVEQGTDAEADFLAYRGEWLASASIRRAQVASARERGDDWFLAVAGFRFAWLALESRLMGADVAGDEWREAEAALADAIEIFDRGSWQIRRVDTRLMMGGFRVVQGRLDEGRRLLAEAQEKVSQQPADLLEVRVQVLVAQVAGAERRWAEAVDALEVSTGIADRLARRWDWARRLLDLAEAHVGRDEPGDLERARELLQQSKAAFEEMGIERYAAVAAQRLDALEAAS